MPASKFCLRFKDLKTHPPSGSSSPRTHSALCTTKIIIIRIVHSVNCEASHLSLSVGLFLTKLINNREILYFPYTYLNLLSPINRLKSNFMVRRSDNLATHKVLKFGLLLCSAISDVILQ